MKATHYKVTIFALSYFVLGGNFPRHEENIAQKYLYVNYLKSCSAWVCLGLITKALLRNSTQFSASATGSSRFLLHLLPNAKHQNLHQESHSGQMRAQTNQTLDKKQKR